MKDALGAVQSVLVLGGGSDIALATCRALVARRARTVVLAARRPPELAAEVEALQVLGATTVEAVPFDAHDDAETHERVVDEVFAQFGDFDLVILAFGVLGDQKSAERDAADAIEVARVNYVGTVSVAVPVANRLRSQGHGTIVALSSVAGERARRSNFVYGSSKAGMDAFLQGLGDSLADEGVDVLVVRPGFVHSKMTDGHDPAPLSTTPDEVAAVIMRGLERGSDTVWAPPAMRYVMTALRHLPRRLFRKLPI